MVTVFEILKAEERRVPKLLHYVSTHPAIDERIAMLEKMAAEARYAPAALLPGTPWASVGSACK
jgi:predicted Zn-dependent protease